MRVYFSFDYKGGNAFLGMKDRPMMMDTLVTDINGLLGFLELRLGLHAVSRRYIYYPVSGLLVEVGESSEAPATDNGNKKKKMATTNQVIFSSTKIPVT